MSNVSVIPVKKNSTRLPGKNLKDFLGESLVQRKIRQLQRVKTVEHIVVSTDCDEAARQADVLGVEVDFRPKDLANETRPLGDFFEYIADKYRAYDDLIWSCCTSPLFDESWISIALDKYLQRDQSEHDSLIVTYKFQHYLLDQTGPINYGLGDNGHSNSQDLPSYYIFTNGVVIAPIDSVKIWRYNYGPAAIRLEVPQHVAVDIDTEQDYLAALAWGKHYEK